MPESLRRIRLGASLLALVLAFSSPRPAAAQAALDEDFVTGASIAAWEKWKLAMNAVLNRSSPDAAEAAFGELLATEPSAFRIALMAERAILRNEGGGGVLLLEQDGKAGTLKENGKRVYDLLEVGREQMNEADDGWYFASVGQFNVAAANFNALIASKPDPVALLEFADRVQRRQQILVTLAGDPVMGEAVKGILRLLEAGEMAIKADPTRIKQHITRLGGAPRMVQNSLGRLKESGEYAVPFMVEALGDSGKRDLIQPILRAMPALDRSALNPLVMALRSSDRAVQIYAIQALGQIPYWQSIPYLIALRENASAAPEVQEAIGEALRNLASRGVAVEPGESAAGWFLRLAESYYADQASLRADPRLETANVWYWKNEQCHNVAVPTAIFNEVMAMRCCEESLRLDPGLKPALSLWLAANFRREAQLPEGAVDATRPENYPTAVYFALSAGPEYCLAALARALDDGDPAVALGSIEALRKTAGPASINGPIGERYPLADALTFGNRMVRIRAALALGGSRPSEFASSQNLMPVLAEAVASFAGSRNALVVDPSTETANLTATALRSGGYTVNVAGDLLGGLQQVRSDVPNLDVIVVASDVPNLQAMIAEIRREPRFGSIPVLVIAKDGTREQAAAAAAADHRVGSISAGADAEVLDAAVSAIAKSVGAEALSAEAGANLAMEACMVLRKLADAGSPLFAAEVVEPALQAAIASSDVALRQAAASVLAAIPTSSAQSAIARPALADAEDEAVRVAMFAALADSAKRSGNLLSDADVKALTALAESDGNMNIRTAASQALGALNLPGNPASVIIRNQYGG